MSFTGIAENASSEDVDANESAIAALQVSVNAKPSVSEVNALNTAQNLAIAAQYYDNSQVDTLLTQKASASGLAAVQAQVQSLPSLTDVRR